MKIKKAVITFLLLLILPVSASSQWHSGFSIQIDKISAGITDIQESIKETKELVASINRFINTITSAVHKVSSLIGGTTVILLLVIMIISSGLGAIGIPRGKATFFSALLIADILWAVWGKSTNAVMMEYFILIAKTNAIILSPFILHLLLKRYSPLLISRIKDFLPLSSGKHLYLKEAEFLTDRLSDESLNLLRSMSIDIEQGKGNGKVFLSQESRNSMSQLKKLLEKLPD